MYRVVCIATKVLLPSQIIQIGVTLRFLSEAGLKIERRPGRPGALKAPIGRLSLSKNT